MPRPVRGELPRPSLLARLDSFEGQLLVLVAPGGYGKTTLLAQHARRQAGRVVWLSLGDEDADPRRLGQRLVDAVQALLPGLECGEWTRWAAQDAAAEGLARALAHDLTGSLLNLDFILDAAERLSESAEGWLACWLDALAEGHRVFLAGRAEPGIGLAVRVAAGQAALIGVAELTFSPDETARCLAGAPAAGSPATVHAQLEGWPVGVALVRAGATPQLTPAQLIQEVLDRLPPELARTLPGASVLEVWTEEAAARLDLGLAPGWLLQVRRAGLPLSPLGTGTYRPHQLLHEVLDAALRRRPERHQALHLQAGALAEQAGDRLRALRHYHRAAAQDRALALAHELSAEYDLRWEYRQVRQVLELFSEHLLPPDLQRTLGHALLETGEAARAELLLYRLRESGTDSPDLSFSLGILAARAGHWTLALEHAAHGVQLQTTQRQRCRLLRLRAFAELRLGQYDASQQTIDQALALARQSQDAVELGAAMLHLIYTYDLLDRLEPLEATLYQTIDLYTRLGMPSRIVGLQIDLASLLRRQNRRSEALDLLAVALPAAEAEQGPDLVSLVEVWGEVLLWQGNFEAALHLYQRAFRLAYEAKQDQVVARTAPLLTEAALGAGEPAAAREVVAWLRPVAEHNQALFFPSLAFCEGLLAIQQQDWPAAHRHFSAVPHPDAPSGIVSTTRAQLYRLTAACQARTLTLADAEQIQTAWADIPTHHFMAADRARLQAIMARCVRPGWPSAALHRLIAGLGSPDASVVAAPVVLHIQTLGGVRARLDGLAVHLPLSKSAEVLVWLALHGGATRDQLVDALWDGSGERRHIDYFKVAVRHLRTALAEQPAVTFNPLPFEEGLYRLSERLTVELDVSQLRAAAASQEVEALRQVVTGYAGAFLPTTETQWAEAIRLELLELTVSAALNLGAQLELTSPEEAAWAYERATELEPLEEEAYIRLLHLYRAHHKQAAAHHLYGRYCRMLAEEWGRTPDEAVMNLVEQRG